MFAALSGEGHVAIRLGVARQGKLPLSDRHDATDTVAWLLLSILTVR